jgi:Ca2+-transporting ATPase
LKPPRPASAIKILVDQFKNVVVILLVVAAVVSVAFEDRLEALAIAAVLVINTALGFVTELRARRAMEALIRFDVSRVTVIRSGRPRTVDAAAMVPGDVFELNAGQIIPADGRLIDATEFRTDEAALTGESLPVQKRAEDVLEPDTPLAERTNMVYKGTSAVGGTGLAVATGTGTATEVGRIGAMIGEIEARRTPLENRLDALGRRLVWLALAVAGLVAVLGALQGAPAGLVIQMGIALAVAAVPEALPVVATVALAVGVRRMARRRALVRRLPAVEALGSATVVCTDKTRTLTSGHMTLVRLRTTDREFEFHDDPPERDPRVLEALEVAALASRPQAVHEDGRSPEGDPEDRALLTAARASGIDRSELTQRRPEVGTVPFSSERKFMASFHRASDGDTAAFVKGAPGRVVEMSRSVRTERGDQTLDDDHRRKLLGINEAMAGEGLRVLALASGPAAKPEESALDALTFVGFVGFIDPPAEGVKEAIARLHGAGLRTLMLTGDQRSTAAAVGRQLNLMAEGDAVLDGRELDELSSEDLGARLPRVAGFSRITPEHKLRLVETLQARGEIVAMLGDGVNDAPALRRADIGVAMGVRGTDVAKEAAAIVLQDDRFETVAAAVEEGRVIFDNIRKFVFYLFSCNVAEVLVLLGAAVAGLPLPLLPLQILWLNMVTDTFPALALAMEPGDADVMTRPPRDPRKALLSGRFVLAVLFYGGLITAATLTAYALSLESSAARARTVAFMTLALAQLLHLGNARSDRPVIRPHRALGNRYAIGAIVFSLGLQLVAMYFVPLADVLGVVALDGSAWTLVVSCAVAPAVVGQALRMVRRRRTTR